MTDVPLDVLTAVLSCATTGVAVAAFVGLRQAAGQSEQALETAARDREANAEARHNEFQASLIIELSQAFETYVHDTRSQTPILLARSRLAALPTSDLPLLRAMMGVPPSADVEDRWRAIGADAKGYAAVREEIRAKLEALTGAQV